MQARVPRELRSALQQEAERRRLSVSHLIRNVLEDTVALVDNVVTEVDHRGADSVDLARQVRRDAAQIAASASGRTADASDSTDASRGQDAPSGTPPATDRLSPDPGAGPPDDGLAHVYAWNAVVLNRPARCARCDATLERGTHAHLGLTQDPAAKPTWLCETCLDGL